MHDSSWLSLSLLNLQTLQFISTSLQTVSNSVQTVSKLSLTTTLHQHPHFEWSLRGLYRCQNLRQNLNHFLNQSHGTVGSEALNIIIFSSSPKWSKPRCVHCGNAPSPNAWKPQYGMSQCHITSYMDLLKLTKLILVFGRYFVGSIVEVGIL